MQPIKARRTDRGQHIFDVVRAFERDSATGMTFQARLLAAPE